MNDVKRIIETQISLQINVSQQKSKILFDNEHEIVPKHILSFFTSKSLSMPDQNINHQMHFCI